MKTAALLFQCSTMHALFAVRPIIIKHVVMLFATFSEPLQRNLTLFCGVMNILSAFQWLPNG